MVSTSHSFAEIDCRLIEAMLGAGFAPSVVYDVGASNGSWTWSISKVLKGAAFHLFEPQINTDASYGQTIANVERYVPNVTLHPIALGAKNRTGRLHLFQTNAAASMIAPTAAGWLKRLYTRGITGNSLSVSVHRLDDYVKRKGLPPPDILKMDVQGFELNVLKGAENTLRETKLILCECWLTRGYGPETPLLHEIVDFLGKRGFVMIDLGEMFYSDQREITAVDAFFLAEEFANRLFPDAGANGVNWRR